MSATPTGSADISFLDDIQLQFPSSVPAPPEPQTLLVSFFPFPGRIDDYGASLVSQAKMVDEAVATKIAAVIEKLKAEFRRTRSPESSGDTPDDGREYINQLITNGDHIRHATRFEIFGIQMLLKASGDASLDIEKYSKIFAQFPLKPVEKAEGKSLVSASTTKV